MSHEKRAATSLGNQFGDTASIGAASIGQRMIIHVVLNLTISERSCIQGGSSYDICRRDTGRETACGRSQRELAKAGNLGAHDTCNETNICKRILSA